MNVIPLVTVLFAAPPTASSPPKTEQVRQAIAKAIPLIEKSQQSYLKQRRCYSCHHQMHGVRALVAARDAGFKIDEKSLSEQIARARHHIKQNTKRYESGRGPGGQNYTAGSVLRTLGIAGEAPDAQSDLVVQFLFKRDEKRGYWRRSGKRPPTSGSDFTNTFLALRSLQQFSRKKDAAKLQARITNAKKWLLKTDAVTTEDRVYRLAALKLAGAAEKEIIEAAKKLLEMQNPDGGWSQTEKMTSDAYATGTVLVALLEAGQIKTTAAAYRKAIGFLLRTQKPDGSWYVKTRAKPVQIYFDAKFPYEKNQFISISATSWAVVALSRSLKPNNQP